MTVIAMLDGIYCIFMSYVAYQDYRTRLIHNRSLLVLLILTLLKLGAYYLGDLSAIIADHIVAALASGIMFFLMYILSGKKMGLGDVLLLSELSFHFGSSLAIAIVFLAMIGLSIWGLGMVVVSRTNAQKSLPLAPFLSGSAWLIYAISLGR